MDSPYCSTALIECPYNALYWALQGSRLLISAQNSQEAVQCLVQCECPRCYVRNGGVILALNRSQQQHNNNLSLFTFSLLPNLLHL